jgi:hypothetical protein
VVFERHLCQQTDLRGGWLARTSGTAQRTLTTCHTRPSSKCG